MKELRRKITVWFTGSLGACLLHWLICLIFKSLRVSYIGADAYRHLVETEHGVIGVFWHGRMFLMSFLCPGQPISLLISAHRDGEIIANVMKLFGYGLVRGSSKSGGSAALREMLKILKNGKDIGITPDGPRGPAESVKPGVAELARLSGKYVIPTSFSARHCIRASSWDRFMIPLPFSRAVLCAGTPLRYEAGEEMESFRSRIESALKQTTEDADRFVAIPKKR